MSLVTLSQFLLYGSIWAFVVIRTKEINSAFQLLDYNKNSSIREINWPPDFSQQVPHPLKNGMILKLYPRLDYAGRVGDKVIFKILEKY